MIAAENDILQMMREAEGERVTAYFNTSGTAQTLESKGEILFALNYEKNKISGHGALVVKNKIVKNQEEK